MKRFYSSALLATVASGLTWAAAVAGPTTTPVTAKADCECGVCQCTDCDGESCTCDDCQCSDCGCGK